MSDQNVNTIGEQRVRVTFNPSSNGTVDIIKQMCAQIINFLYDEDPIVFARAVDFGLTGTSEMIYNMKKPKQASEGEFTRLKNLALKELKEVNPETPKEEALTKVELAAMWAVKAATCC